MIGPPYLAALFSWPVTARQMPSVQALPQTSVRKGHRFAASNSVEHFVVLRVSSARLSGRWTSGCIDNPEASGSIQARQAHRFRPNVLGVHPLERHRVEAVTVIAPFSSSEFRSPNATCLGVPA